jgi:hypothetical protein
LHVYLAGAEGGGHGQAINPGLSCVIGPRAAGLEFNYHRSFVAPDHKTVDDSSYDGVAGRDVGGAQYRWMQGKRHFM